MLLSTYQRLAAVYVQMSRFEDACALLPAARAYADRAGVASGLHQQKWIEALVWRGLGELDAAELLLDEALEGFVSLGERMFSAMVLLDQAAFFCDTNQDQKVLEACTKAIPLFESIHAHREALVAAEVLREAVARQSFRSEVFLNLRSQLERSPSGSSA